MLLITHNCELPAQTLAAPLKAFSADAWSDYENDELTPVRVIREVVQKALVRVASLPQTFQQHAEVELRNA